MAIQKLSQISAGRNASAKHDLTRRYTVVWRAIVTDPRDGPATVMAALAAQGVVLYTPYVGYENASDPLALLTEMRPDVEGPEGEWRTLRITGTFSTDWAEGQQQQPNPEDEPVLFWIETSFETRKVTKTWNGVDITNSADQLLDGLEREDAVETWVWERNYLSINRSLWKQYQNRINSATVAGEIDPKTGRLHILVAKPSFRNGTKFHRVQFRVKVNPDGWPVNPADRGTAVKNAAGDLERPVDDLGQPMDGEVFLDGAGKQLAAGAPIVYIGAKDLHEPKDLNNLGVFD